MHRTKVAMASSSHGHRGGWGYRTSNSLYLEGMYCVFCIIKFDLRNKETLYQGLIKVPLQLNWCMSCIYKLLHKIIARCWSV